MANTPTPIVFYLTQLYYCFMTSFFTTYFVLPPLAASITRSLWLIFFEKRWDILFAVLLYVSAAVYYHFHCTEAEAELTNFNSQTSSQSYTLGFDQPDIDPQWYQIASDFLFYQADYHHQTQESPPSSPSSAPPSSPSSSLMRPWSAPPSSLPSPVSSLSSNFSSSSLRSELSSPQPQPSLRSELSSPQPSLRSELSSPQSMYSPPPPPFKMKPWRFLRHGDYVRMASEISLSSSETSDDTDIDTKAERFITRFRDQHKVDTEF